jgi:hypothetical protein
MKKIKKLMRKEIYRHCITVIIHAFLWVFTDNLQFCHKEMERYLTVLT